MKRLLKSCTYLLVYLSFIFLNTCQKESEDIKSSEKKLTTFEFRKDNNAGLNANCTCKIDQEVGQITGLVENGTNVSTLKANFSVSQNAELFKGGTKQISGQSTQNYSAPVVFAVKAEDGTTTEYKVVIDIEKSSENKILSFSFGSSENPTLDQTQACEISEEQQTISAKLPYGTESNKLIPSFVLSEKAKLLFDNQEQISGQTAHDFFSAVTYEVEAENGAKRTYTVNITVEQIQSLSNPVIEGVSYESATISASLSCEGDAEVSHLGLCWGQKSNPTMEDNTSEFETTDPIQHTITALQKGTTYHARSYAKSNLGIVYSEDIEFTTLREGELPTFVKPLIDNQWEAHAWPYNAYNPADNENVDKYYKARMYNNHYTNACGPTALARLLYNLRYPVDHLSGNFDYYYGGMHFQCNGNIMELNYEKMPKKLTSESTEEQYHNVAKLMQFTSAFGDYLYQMPDGSQGGRMGGINMTNNGAFMTKLRYFLNTTDDLRIINRWEYSQEEWIRILKNELAHGRTVLIAGRTVESPAPWEEGNVFGHWFNVEGYNENNEFFVSFNLAEEQKYYDVDDFGRFKAYNQMVLGFIPK